MASNTHRTLFYLTLLVALLTTIWVVALIYTQASSPAAFTLAEYLARIESRSGLFVFSYLNAGLLTLCNVALLAGYALYGWPKEPLWSGMALVFVPVYGLANLVVYLSQVFVVPGLLEWYHQPETAELAAGLLALTLQEWPGSAAGFLNSLAYAVLGIPSLILGMLFFRAGRPLRPGGLLLAVSGALSILGLIGLGIGSMLLNSLTLVSGAVFLLALFALAWAFRSAPPPIQP